MLVNADGIAVSEFVTLVEDEEEEPIPVRRGQRLQVSSELENPLTPGRYFIHCGVNRTGGAHGISLYAHNAASFVVFGSDNSRGAVLLPHETEVVIEGGDG
jgi:hypothetical protein